MLAHVDVEEDPFLCSADSQSILCPACVQSDAYEVTFISR